jgi:hypothetical protein
MAVKPDVRTFEGQPLYNDVSSLSPSLVDLFDPGSKTEHLRSLTERGSQINPRTSVEADAAIQQTAVAVTQISVMFNNVAAAMHSRNGRLWNGSVQGGG